MVSFDPTINLGHILTVVVVGVGGLGVVWTLLARMEGVEKQISNITTLLVADARHDERLTAQDKRLNTMADDIAALRRGEGLIVKKG